MPRFEILGKMLKEEWRIHSVMFGGAMFALFPLLLVIFVFTGSMFLPLIKLIIPVRQFAILAHYLFLLFGISVGGFGLFGREVMNRRFGQASLIAYSSRSLPVSEKKIFANFLVKDIIYYFFLWIVPFAAGFAIASPLLSISLGYSAVLLLTFTLSFLIGLSVVFFLSTLYAYSSKMLVSVIAFIALAMVAFNYFNAGFLPMLPSIEYFFEPSYDKLVLSFFIIAIPAALSLAFLKIDYPDKKKRFRNSIITMSKKIPFREYACFIAKDFLDLSRSEGGPGKIIFSFLFPLAIVWPMVLIFLEVLPIVSFIIVFSVFLGVISSTIYNWLTEFDMFTSYAFLPVKVSTLIKSKVRGYAIINSLSIIILVMATVFTGAYSLFLPSFFAFLSISSYTVAVTIYLAGLHSNILLYNAKIFLAYVAAIAPVLLVLTFLSVINVNYLLISPVLMLIAYYLIRKSYDKWDTRTEASF